MNTAVTWLLTGDVATLPAVLQSAAKEVRDAIEQDQIRELHIWYSHNAPESKNVKEELDQAAITADSLIHRHFGDAEVEVSALEVGLAQLERLYERTEAPIAVADRFTLAVSGGFEIHGGHWSA